MKASELRIGNYVDHEQTTHEILGLGDGEVHHRWLKATTDETYITPYSEISGIPLTAEWMQRFGTYLIPERNALFPKFGFQQLANTIYFAGENLGWQMMNRYGHYYPVFIKHVHQLQNLYFALTGNELEFKER